MFKYFIILQILIPSLFAFEIDTKNLIEVDPSTLNFGPCDNRPNEAHFARNPRGCAWFFACNPGLPPLEGRCDDPFFFNYVSQACDWQENVDCVDPEPSDTCPEWGVTFLPHPYSCSKYAVCFDGTVQDRDCPPGLYFSFHDQLCVDSSLVVCDADEEFCRANQNVAAFPFVPSSRNCDRYFICVDNIAIPRRCSNDWEFNPVTGFCENPETAGCDRTNVLPPAPKLPEKLFYDCTSADEGRSIPHPESCEFWFLCSGGRSILLMCGPETVFDRNLLRCTSNDYPNVECNI